MRTLSVGQLQLPSLTVLVSLLIHLVFCQRTGVLHLYTWINLCAVPCVISGCLTLMDYAVFSVCGKPYGSSFSVIRAAWNLGRRISDLDGDSA